MLRSTARHAHCRPALIMRRVLNTAHVGRLEIHFYRRGEGNFALFCAESVAPLLWAAYGGTMVNASHFEHIDGLMAAVHNDETVGCLVTSGAQAGMLAVQPPLQRMGIGSIMLRTLQQLDPAQQPATITMIVGKRPHLIDEHRAFMHKNDFEEIADDGANVAFLWRRPEPPVTR